MRYVVIAALTLLFFASCGRQFHPPKSLNAADTSHVYALPYPEGEKHLLIQGYNSWLSHKGRLALDFKMKKGSQVTAARDGVVVSVQEEFTDGGVHKKFYRKANSVVIRHRDGSQAFYGHLQHNGVIVSIGDTVRKGQPIAFSGSTGYSALPHLHFIVWGPTPKGRRQLPTRFSTSKGILYLRPGRWYK